MASSPTRKMRTRLEKLLVSEHGIDTMIAKQVAKAQARGWRRLLSDDVDAGTEDNGIPTTD